MLTERLGIELHEIIDKIGTLSPAATRKIATDIGSALAYMHRRFIVHHDIKPLNIMTDIMVS